MQYEILKSFAGSQDGRITEQFDAGTVRDLSEYLASAAPAGSIRPVKTVEVENKAIITEPVKGGRKTKAAQ
jgi:hypothetical protein